MKIEGVQDKEFANIASSEALILPLTPRTNAKCIIAVSIN